MANSQMKCLTVLRFGVHSLSQRAFAALGLSAWVWGFLGRATLLITSAWPPAAMGPRSANLVP